MKKTGLFVISIFASILLQAQDLIKYVDMKFGVAGTGNCVIGPQLPFASINPSPDTQNGNTDGYNPNEKIRGFSQLHVSGTGGPGKYGQFLLSPQIGLNIDEQGHDSDKADEQALVGYYKVRLTKYNIFCEFTPTEHAVIYRFTYPKSDSTFLLLDLGHNIPGDITTWAEGKFRGGYAEKGAVHIDEQNNRITGSGIYWGGWSAEPFLINFCMEFNKTPKIVGTWKDSTISFNNTNETIDRKAQRIGAIIGFNTKDDEEIMVRIAVSFKSVDNAIKFLHDEIPDWDFNQVRKSAEKIWDKELNKIVIKTDSANQKRVFYSALYRTMLMPRDRSGDNPKWNSDMPYWDDHYCIWDTWKTAFPLNLLINEKMVADNVNAFIDRYEHNGQVLDAFIAGNDRVYEWQKFEVPYYCRNQGGDNADNVIADAFVKGVKGVDWERVYKLLQFDANSMRTPSYLINNRGWVPFRTYEYAFDCSRTVEFAYNDFCVSQVAKELHKQTDYKKYVQRSVQWKNLWNDTLSSDNFKGFICPKTINGNWLDYNPKMDKLSYSPGGFDRNFYEGNSWIYSYFVPHDFYQLIKLMGGQDAFVKRLQYALKNNMIDFGNEPSLLTPFSFIYAGRPDLTAYWVRENLKRYRANSFPGDEDSGAMGSWYVFASMGIFPNAGQDIYLLSAPALQQTIITRENNAKIVIEAENLSEQNIYIQSATLNGKPLDRAWLKHDEIANGANLKFIMGSTPSDWGKNNLPPKTFVEESN